VTNKAYLSRHVVFDESSFPAKKHVAALLPSQLSSSGKSDPFLLSIAPLSIPTYPSTDLPSPHVSNTPSDASNSQLPSPELPSLPFSLPGTSDLLSTESLPSTPSSPSPHPSPDLPVDLSPGDPLPTLSPSPMPSPPAPSSFLPSTDTSLAPSCSQSTHPMTTRSHTGHLRLTHFPGFKLYHSRYPFLSYVYALPEFEPSCYSKAAADLRWQAAMAAEFAALTSTGTWSLCPCPQNQHVIHNKWVFKIKRKANGSVERFKARLVAKGFEQQAGIDYTETFSPVIKPATIQLLLTLAMNFGSPIRQLDISNAFLHGYLSEEVYMEQPQGFVDKANSQLVCKLYKAIYGLKQAPKAWYTRLSQFLLDLGFIASLVDTYLFLHINGSIKLFILIYVDDIIVTGTHPHLISALISRMQQEFPVKDLGPLSYFLGIQVTRNSTGLHLCQSKYVAEILTPTHMADAKPATSPCTSGSKLSRFDGDLLLDFSAYRSLVGALQYSTLTGRDIAYSVNQLCQHLHHPTSVHWIAAKRVLRYLKSTSDHGLTYAPSNL
jgi:hypothetical protein